MKLRDKESVFGSRNRPDELETASAQIHRERRERRLKRAVRRRKRLELLARRHGVDLNKIRKPKVSLLKRIRWSLIKFWRKLTRSHK